MIPPFLIVMRGDAMGRLVGLEAGATIAAILCLILSEQYHRAPFIDVALALALLSFGSGLVFTRFLERWL